MLFTLRYKGPGYALSPLTKTFLQRSHFLMNCWLSSCHRYHLYYYWSLSPWKRKIKVLFVMTSLVIFIRALQTAVHYLPAVLQFPPGVRLIRRPLTPLSWDGGWWLMFKKWQWNNNFLVLDLAGIFMQDWGTEKSRQILNPQRPERFIIKYVSPGLHTTEN